MKRWSDMKPYQVLAKSKLGLHRVDVKSDLGRDDVISQALDYVRVKYEVSCQIKKVIEL